MIAIEIIRQRINSGSYEMTLHARSRMGQRKISMSEIKEAIKNGEIIEQYPKDEPFPSCLVMGYVRGGFPLYIVCAVSQILHIITAHWLDPTKWLDPKTRREKKT